MQQQDSISIADEQWQAVYTDNTLRNLIARALEYNKDMLVAAARVKEMAAQKRISVANLLPQLNGKIEAEREVENYGGHSRDVEMCIRDRHNTKAGLCLLLYCFRCR